jgi:hypothetical protein
MLGIRFVGVAQGTVTVEGGHVFPVAPGRPGYCVASFVRAGCHANQIGRASRALPSRAAGAGPSVCVCEGE